LKPDPLDPTDAEKGEAVVVLQTSLRDSGFFLERARRSLLSRTGAPGFSRLHLGGVPWARIGEHIGQRDLTVTANTYSHVLVDEAELDYEILL